LPPALVTQLVRVNKEGDEVVGPERAEELAITARASATDTLLDIRGVPFHLAPRVLRAIVAALA
jgi:hypothetical protein